jgi:hypothetical protein
MGLTTHDILAMIHDLTIAGEALSSAAEGQQHLVNGAAVVLCNPNGMRTGADSLLNIRDDLKQLIPNEDVALQDAATALRKTLVRIILWEPQSLQVVAILPEWNRDTPVTIKLMGNGDLFDFLKGREGFNVSKGDKPVRVHAWINLGAKTPTGLEFTDWEL